MIVFKKDLSVWHVLSGLPNFVTLSVPVCFLQIRELKEAIISFLTMTLCVLCPYYAK